MKKLFAIVAVMGVLTFGSTQLLSHWLSVLHSVLNVSFI